MQFSPALIPARLLRRYKRFLADVSLDDGTQLTVHCPDPGSMRGVAVPGRRVMLSYSANPARRYAHTLEMIHNGRTWIGVHPALANRLVAEALNDESIVELQGYTQLRREVTPKDLAVLERKQATSRFDFELSGGRRRKACYLETKSVSLVINRLCAFPDAPTVRGQRHLEDLIQLRRMGFRVVVLYVIQRGDGRALRMAHEIDPVYAQRARQARAAGVEMLAYRAKVRPSGIVLRDSVPLMMDD